ncbi:MAG: nickel pincer cofactor biosynthesis protein LarB [bacterium]
MSIDRLKEILLNVKEGQIDIDSALEKLKLLPYENINFARIDHHRSLRQGVAEVIFCKGKSIDQVVEIAKRILDSGNDVLATRTSRDIYEKINLVDKRAIYNEAARTIVVKQKETELKGKIVIVSAGTADIPVAEEAKVTAETLGSFVSTIYDVGVAGIHRLFGEKEELFSGRVIVVVAGMDGVLPSVVGGIVDRPVIAVPTSIGYGANFGGLAALLAMLNSCAAGVSVVNIGNGFGAGYIAHKINTLPKGEK